MNHLAQLKIAIEERRRIMQLIEDMANASTDPACCKRFARKIKDAVKRGAHLAEAA